MSVDLAIAIVSWNVRGLLTACLESVQVAVQAAGLKSAIWVVDNASEDGSVEALRERFDGVRLIASSVNLWFGGGQNVALRAMGYGGVQIPAVARIREGELYIADRPTGIEVEEAPPRYALLLNPDTVVHEDALSELIRFMDRRSHVGVSGPSLFYGDGRFQHAAYRFPSLAQTFFDFWSVHWRLSESSLNGRYPRRRYESGQPFPIDHPLGAAMVFRGEVIQQIGGFDLDYSMYVEEIDWCIRVKRLGWSVFCVPQAKVIHYEGQSTRQVRPQMVVALWDSRYTLFRKHYSRAFRWAARRIIRTGMMAKIRRARKALAQGTMDAPTAQALTDAYRQVMAM